MLTWNYRVMQIGDELDPCYVIVEAYYGADEHIEGTTGAIKPMGDDLEGLRSDLNLMLLALSQPILDADPNLSE